MKLKPKLTIAEYFNDLDDPRVEQTKRHQLIDMTTAMDNNYLLKVLTTLER